MYLHLMVRRRLRRLEPEDEHISSFEMHVKNALPPAITAKPLRRDEVTQKPPDRAAGTCHDIGGATNC
jgi:hypothetical protein